MFRETSRLAGGEHGVSGIDPRAVCALRGGEEVERARLTGEKQPIVDRRRQLRTVANMARRRIRI
jgi:hypothetical protein